VPCGEVSNPHRAVLPRRRRHRSVLLIADRDGLDDAPHKVHERMLGHLPLQEVAALG
jgi:hypothetical protein